MEGLLQAFRANWASFGISSGHAVLLALSGGIDSMVLADLLLEAGIPFAAAHCNFQLRGDESEGDEAFVTSWAAVHDVRLHAACFDPASDKKPGQSIQMAARELRYAWFEELRQQFGYATILTAHHGGDLAETILINLVRGTGISGLAGIPERNGTILRPLLFASRTAIDAYAAARSLVWREDSSNASEKYLRNAIRHRVLPVLEELAPGAGLRIAESARRVGGSLPIYESALEKLMKPLMEIRGRDRYVPIRLLRKQPHIDTLIFELFAPFGFGGAQVAGIRALMDASSGRQLRSGSHRLFRDRDFLIVTDLEPAAADMIRIEDAPAEVVFNGGRLEFSIVATPADVPDGAELALLDMRDIRFPLTLRTRREGDYFYPLGMGGKKKKLKRFLTDIKMPVPQKERLMILEQEGKVLWVVGARIDERFRLRPDTNEALQIRLIRHT